MAKLISARAFVDFIVSRYYAKDGYIMGATGQDPSKWSAASWWITQYKGSQRTKALYWRAHAQRVWDCNGLAEGYYHDQTGVSINQRARNNYASWCSIKGKGVIPAARRVPGAAVFKANLLGIIHHVGYLWKPVTVGRPSGDWYVIEAKGVMYGVIRSRLSDGGWNRWGWMTKYFDYVQPSTDQSPPASTALGSRMLERGDYGDDVAELQRGLTQLKFDPKGIDKDFGPNTQKAVKKFQKAQKIEVDGVVGPITVGKLKAALKAVTAS